MWKKATTLTVTGRDWIPACLLASCLGAVLTSDRALWWQPVVEWCDISVTWLLWCLYTHDCFCVLYSIQCWAKVIVWHYHIAVAYYIVHYLSILWLVKGIFMYISYWKPSLCKETHVTCRLNILCTVENSHEGFSCQSSKRYSVLCNIAICRLRAVIEYLNTR